MTSTIIKQSIVPLLASKSSLLQSTARISNPAVTTVIRTIFNGVSNNDNRFTKRGMSTIEHPSSPETTTKPRRILVTGASGQIGLELVPHLRKICGHKNVIASDLHQRKILSSSHHRTCNGDKDENCNNEDEPQLFCRVDVLDPEQLARVINDNEIDTIVHLAAILSAKGEENPLLALKINNNGIQNVLEVAKKNKLKVFSPSSIAVFGGFHEHKLQRLPVGDDCMYLRPITMYGITKLYMELLGEYYYREYGVDFRSLRLPGVISSQALPGGGTTDYAVTMFHDAINYGNSTCYLHKDTALPMIYMPDLLNGITNLLLFDDKASAATAATSSSLHRRTYNIGSVSFTPDQLESSIRKFIPTFTVQYPNRQDFRQAIADSWPNEIDDSNAQHDWEWKPDSCHNLDAMTHDMLYKLLLSKKDSIEDVVSGRSSGVAPSVFSPVMTAKINTRAVVTTTTPQIRMPHTTTYNIEASRERR